MTASILPLSGVSVVELIWAHRRHVEPGFQRQHFRVKDETSCWLLLEGGVSARCDTRREQVEPGQWLFPGDREADISFTPDARILSIRFRLLHAHGGRVFDQPGPRRIAGETAAALRPRAETLVDRVEPWRGTDSLLLGRDRVPFAENLEIEAAFHRWLAAYSRAMALLGARPRQPGRGDERVTRALERIQRHPLRTPFTEAELAAACGIGLRQLRRLVERETGASPFAHYDQRRLELARHVLRESSLPIKAIAYDLGFLAPPHFSNWFKKRVGQSPRAFREHRDRHPHGAGKG